MAQYIANGGFESSANWTLSARASIQNSNAYSGSSCVAFTNQGIGGLVYASQTVTLTPGKAYELTWYAKRSGRYDVWCAYGYYDANGNYKWHDSPSMESKVGTTYNKLSYTVIIPPGARNNVQIMIKAGADAVNGNTYAYVDNVELKDKSTGGNLLINGGFESGSKEGWYAPSDATVVTGGAYEGSRYLRAQHAGNVKWASTFGQELNLMPGKTYTMSIMFQATGPDSGAMCGFQYFNSSGQQVVTYCSRVTGNNTWKKITHSFTLPSNASSTIVFAVFILETNATYTQTGGMFDAIQAYEGTGSAPGGVIPDPAPGYTLLGTRYLNVPFEKAVTVHGDMSTSSPAICQLTRGATVTAYQTNSSSWIYIKTPTGQEGYIQNTANLVSTVPPVSATPLGNRYVDGPIGYSMYVFAEPNTSSTRLGSLPRGALVKAYSVGNSNFLLIQTTTTSVVYEGYIGITNLLSQPPRTGTNAGTRYINCTAGYSLYLYMEPTQTSTKRYTIPRNTEVTAYDMGVSGWKFVCSATGAYGYCMDTSLSTTPLRNVTLLGERYIDSPIGYYKKIFAEPNTSNQKYSWIRNTHVKAYTIDVPNWVLVVNDSGAEGYMMGSGLSISSLAGGASLGIKYVSCDPTAKLPLHESATTASQVNYKLLRATAVDCFDTAQAGYTFVRDRNTSLNPRPEGYCQSDFLSGTVPADEVLEGGYKVGYFVEVYNLAVGSPLLKVRPSAGTSESPIGNLRNGSRFVCQGVEKDSSNRLWIKIRWCGVHSTWGYLLSDNVKMTTIKSKTAMEDAFVIALSLADKGHTKADLGLTGTPGWCVQYNTAMMRVAYGNDRPGDDKGLVSESREYYVGKSEYDDISPDRSPKIGDWIYYDAINPYVKDAHVGLVTAVTEDSISTVEGSVEDTAKTYTFNITGHSRDYIITGFASPNWNL